MSTIPTTTIHYFHKSTLDTISVAFFSSVETGVQKLMEQENRNERDIWEHFSEILALLYVLDC